MNAPPFPPSKAFPRDLFAWMGMDELGSGNFAQSPELACIYQRPLRDETAPAEVMTMPIAHFGGTMKIFGPLDHSEDDVIEKFLGRN